jgi:calcium-translocating P-type ATPase
MSNYHTQEIDQLLKSLQSAPKGLSDDEASARLNKYGKNILPKGKRVTFGHVLIHQFMSPIIYVLIGAAILAFVMDEYLDAFFIFLVLVINATIGTYQEWSAEQSAEGLQELISIKTRVLRNAKEVVVDAAELVPGDVILFESGSKVPADTRLFEVNNLSIDEAFLTGESVPVAKVTHAIDGEKMLGERKNMAFAGSTVMSGRGVGLIVGTGHDTEVGKIAQNLAATKHQKTPLVQRMEKFASQVTYVVMTISVLLAIAGYIKGFDLAEIMFYIVALAVSAIPEGLPISITVALSIATSRMAKRNVIVKKLAAVEGLGSCTFIASDKTGTLTINSQTVRKVILPDGQEIDITGSGYNGEGKVNAQSEEFKLVSRLAEAASICNEGQLFQQADGGWESHGDAVDIAFLALSYKCGINLHEMQQKHRILKQIPYESEKKYAATVYETSGQKVLVVKGAPEALLSQTKFTVSGDEAVPVYINKVESQIHYLTATGYRVLAVWEALVDRSDLEVEDCNLTLMGLVGLYDPLREESIPAVLECKQAGIQVAMVTGDHPQTALAISKQLGIAEDESCLITGAQLPKNEVVSDEWWQAIKDKTVFARVSPIQKMMIASTLSANGHFVAVTGDGVNDVPALKRAHIGVAMGSGTDLAKDTSSIIITNDDFSSIVAGVEEGRFAYDNIRKVIALLVSTGAAEIMVFLLAMGIDLGYDDIRDRLPFTALQLLWLNLVTNGIQDKALAFEKGEIDTMTRKPRNPKEGIFNRLMIEQIVVGGLAMGVIAFSCWTVLAQFDFTVEHKRTLTLMLMVLMQNMHVFNCRSERNSTFSVPLRNNRVLIFAVLGAQAVHIIASNIPFMQRILNTDSVSITEWLILLPVSVLLIVVMELYKKLRARAL